MYGQSYARNDQGKKIYNIYIYIYIKSKIYKIEDRIKSTD